MLAASMLPWWAYGYLLIYFALTCGGAIFDVKERPASIAGDALSFFFACVFVYAYFDFDLAARIGLLLIPMLIIGLAWEFTQAVHDTNRAESEILSEEQMTDQERNVLLNIGVGLGALIILPAYMMGLKTCFDLVMGML